MKHTHHGCLEPGQDGAPIGLRDIDAERKSKRLSTQN
jgi:hypothetical protein